MLEDQSRKPEARGDYRLRYEDQQVTIGGVTYRQKQNLITILIMGVDQQGTETDRLFGEFGHAGQSDFLRLVVIDPVDKTIAQIPIDRDTITPITTYSIDGVNMGKRNLNITLAYSYGDGKKRSCEMAVDAVSNLLYNVPIGHYLAMNMNGISELNDAVGGVTVHIDDDFSQVDPVLVQGTDVRLEGEHAEVFVRSRMSMEVGTNEARMARQQVYISELIRLLNEKIQADQEYVGTLFDVLNPYLTTNLSRAELVNDAWRSRDYERLPVVEIAGTHEYSTKGYMQFFPDEASLQDAVLSVFYRKLQ